MFSGPQFCGCDCEIHGYKATEDETDWPGGWSHCEATTDFALYGEMAHVDNPLWRWRLLIH